MEIGARESRRNIFTVGRRPRPLCRPRRLQGVWLAGLLATGILPLSACQAPLQPTGPAEIVLRIPDYEAFFDESLSVLRRAGFPPEYSDHTRGTVISEPATSGQWFEPWRVDSQGGYQLLESSLHTMRRVVTVQVEPLDTNPDKAAADNEAEAVSPRYRVAVRVDKSRYSAPERQVTTASGALAIYSERLPTTEGLRGAKSRGATWVPLGRDGLLEDLLLARLADAAPGVVAAE